LATRYLGFRAYGFAAETLVVDNGSVVADNGQAVAETVDLGGAAVVPAFRDGHAHPLFAGREALGPRVSEAVTIAEIVETVREFATTSRAEWIVGGAYPRSLHPSPLASWLDEAEAARPVVLHASDHHTIWVNSEALRRAGLLESIPPLTNGSVDVDENGCPTGVLREPGAMALVLDLIPERTLADELDALDWAQRELASFGIVEVQDAWITRGEIETYIEAARQNRLMVDVKLAFRIEAESWREDAGFFEEARRRVVELENPRLKVNAAKFFADGVFGSATAAVLEPYHSDGSHGEPVWSESELFAATAHYAAAGYQLHIHAIGDAGVRMALDAIEHSGALASSLPSVIAHTELVANQDIARFKELNVIANFEPLWAREDGMLLSCLPHLGRERINQMYRMRDLIDSGATLSFGSDWPVSSPDPLFGIATAVNRALPGGASWVPEQALSFEEALLAYTAGVCKQLGRGAPLNPGEPAQFLVLNQHPIDGQQLFELRVEKVQLDLKFG
jgi:predicted amidohydrolase YtcJ